MNIILYVQSSSCVKPPFIYDDTKLFKAYSILKVVMIDCYQKLLLYDVVSNIICQRAVPKLNNNFCNNDRITKKKDKEREQRLKIVSITILSLQKISSPFSLEKPELQFRLRFWPALVAPIAPESCSFCVLSSLWRFCFSLAFGVVWLSYGITRYGLFSC